MNITGNGGKKSFPYHTYQEEWNKRTGGGGGGVTEKIVVGELSPGCSLICCTSIEL